MPSSPARKRSTTLGWQYHQAGGGQDGGAQPEVRTIMMDYYEQGLIDVVRSTYEDVQLAGCDFHWKSYIRKRIAADGLQLLYNDDLQFSMLIRYIWALSYVPPDKGVSAWTTVIQLCEKNFTSIIIFCAIQRFFIQRFFQGC
jgi:hypothetical protein